MCTQSAKHLACGNTIHFATFIRVHKGFGLIGPQGIDLFWVWCVEALKELFRQLRLRTRRQRHLCQSCRLSNHVSRFDDRPGVILTPIVQVQMHSGNAS